MKLQHASTFHSPLSLTFRLSPPLRDSRGRWHFEGGDSFHSADQRKRRQTRCCQKDDAPGNCLSRLDLVPPMAMPEGVTSETTTGSQSLYQLGVSAPPADCHEPRRHGFAGPEPAMVCGVWAWMFSPGRRPCVKRLWQGRSCKGHLVPVVPTTNEDVGSKVGTQSPDMTA